MSNLSDAEKCSSYLDEYFNSEPLDQDDAAVLHPLSDSKVENAFYASHHNNTEIVTRFCKICHESTLRAGLENVLCCFGCGEVCHRSCVSSCMSVLCPVPIIYRFARSVRESFMTHAPWYCNFCVQCSSCRQKWRKCVCCRKCGNTLCLSCLRQPEFCSLAYRNLSNFACESCLECVNCGYRHLASEKQQQQRQQRVLNLYDDNRLCRPCYLSGQLNAICPVCQQIYHWLPLMSDFGEVPFNGKFSLCPMVECDGCDEWVHCVCEDITASEYEKLGRDKRRKFFCFNCRLGKRAERDFFNGPDFDTKNAYIFTFRNPVNAWKLGWFALTFADGRFLLKTDSFEICATSLQELKEKFDAVLSSDDAATCFINWQRALKSHLLFDPGRLISTRTCPAVVKTALQPFLPDSCARTLGYQPRARPVAKMTPGSHPRTSLQSLHLAQSMSCRSSSISASVKIPASLLYMQYLNTVRLDDSFQLVNAYSLGLALRPSGIAGLGLFAAKFFPAGSLIIEYCGEMLHSEQMVNRRDAYYNALGTRYRRSCYLFRLDSERVLDATLKGNLSRFINHSCDPNSYSRVVSLDMKDKKLLIFALKNIEPGEEILYDYKFPEEDCEKLICYCGSSKCRGFMN